MLYKCVPKTCNPRRLFMLRWDTTLATTYNCVPKCPRSKRANVPNPAPLGTLARLPLLPTNSDILKRHVSRCVPCVPLIHKIDECVKSAPRDARRHLPRARAFSLPYDHAEHVRDTFGTHLYILRQH